MTGELKQAALDYAARGWPVLPLHNPTPDGGCSCGAADCSSVGKHPRTARGLNDATTDPAKINESWARWPDANVGIRTGEESGFIVLDVDRGEAMELLTSFGREMPPDALCQRTGNGWQFLFEHPGFKVSNSAAKIAPDVDVRGDGGYIVAPPSHHKNGKQYRWLTEGEPGPAPEWLLDLLRPTVKPTTPATAPTMRHAVPDAYLEAALQSEAERVRQASEGTRNDTLNRAAFSLGQLEAAGLSHADTESVLVGAAVGAGLTAGEARKTFASGWEDGREDPRAIPERPQSTRPVPSDSSLGAGAGPAEPESAGPELAASDGFAADVPDPDHAQPTAGPKPDKPPTQNVSDKLVKIGRDHYELGMSNEGEPFGVPRSGPGIARLLRGHGGSLRADLSATYLDIHSKAANQSALADAMMTLEGLAARSERSTLHVRYASHEGAVWIDLGDAEGRCVCVSSDGWTVEPQAPVLFRRTALTGTLPIPEPGDLSRLRDFLNVTDEGWSLLVGWLVSLLHPDIPHPLLMLTGEQGSAKSTTGRLLIDLVDPSPAPLRTSPRDIGDWVTVAAGSAVVGLDNLSNIPAWLSDALCRAVTGDGFPRRQLYTDGEITVTAFRRSVLLTGIDLGALSGDLVDRGVFVDLQRIPADRRRLESDLDRDFAAVRPRLFGGLLDLVAATLRYLPDVRLAGYPRMADHAKVLAALDMAVPGLDALDSFLAVSGRAFEEAAEGDQVASAARHHMSGRESWDGELSDLLDELTQTLKNPDRPPKGWPTDASRLSARLKRAAPGLRAVGICVEFGMDRESRHRTASLRTEKAGISPCLPCSSRGVQAEQAEQGEIQVPSNDMPATEETLSSLPPLSQAALVGEPAKAVEL